MTLGAYAVCLCCVLRCFRYEGEGAGGQVELAASSAAEWSRARRGQVCQGFRLFLKTTSRKREKRKEKRREREEREKEKREKDGSLSLSLFFFFFLGIFQVSFPSLLLQLMS